MSHEGKIGIEASILAAYSMTGSFSTRDFPR